MTIKISQISIICEKYCVPVILTAIIGHNLSILENSLLNCMGYVNKIDEICFKIAVMPYDLATGCDVVRNELRI